MPTGDQHLVRLAELARRREVYRSCAAADKKRGILGLPDGRDEQGHDLYDLNRPDIAAYARPLKQRMTEAQAHARALVKFYGSIAAAAEASGIEPRTLIMARSGSFTRLREPTPTRLAQAVARIRDTANA